MAASASLEGASKAANDKDSTEYLAMANKMLSKYRAAAQALTLRQQSLGETPGKAEDKCHQYMLVMVSKCTANLLNGISDHFAKFLPFVALLRHVICMFARTCNTSMNEAHARKGLKCPQSIESTAKLVLVYTPLVTLISVADVVAATAANDCKCSVVQLLQPLWSYRGTPALHVYTSNTCICRNLLDCTSAFWDAQCKTYAV